MTKTKSISICFLQACRGCTNPFKCDCKGIVGEPGDKGIYGQQGSEGAPGEIGLMLKFNLLLI